jgi:hypothetical protein
MNAEIIGNIVLDLIVLSLVILVASTGIFGLGEEASAFWKLDIGSKIMTIGVFWIVGSLLRICISFPTWFSSLACAIGTFLFGHCLATYGLFTAFAVSGFYLWVTAFFSCLLSPSYAFKAVLVGLVLVCLGMPLRKFNAPTCPEDNHAPSRTQVYDSRYW